MDLLRNIQNFQLSCLIIYVSVHNLELHKHYVRVSTLPIAYGLTSF